MNRGLESQIFADGADDADSVRGLRRIQSVKSAKSVRICDSDNGEQQELIYKQEVNHVTTFFVYLASTADDRK